MATSEKSWSAASQLDFLQFSIDEEDLIENMKPNLISLTLSDSCSTQLSPDKTLNDYETFNDNEQYSEGRMNSFHGDDSLEDNSSDSILFLLEEPTKMHSARSQHVTCNMSNEHTHRSNNSERTCVNEAEPLVKRNISSSLHDLRRLPQVLPKSKSQVSLGAAHSQSMLAMSPVLKSKDSGFTHSLSLLSLNSTGKGYEHVESKVRKYIKEIKLESALKRKQILTEKKRCSSVDSIGCQVSGEKLQDVIEKLENDVEEKTKMLLEVQSSYNALLLKYAEAENRIDRLRFKVLDSSAPADDTGFAMSAALDKSVQVSELNFPKTKNLCGNDSVKQGLFHQSSSCKDLEVKTVKEPTIIHSSVERIHTEQNGVSSVTNPDPCVRLPVCSTEPYSGTKSNLDSWTGMPVCSVVPVCGSSQLNSGSYHPTRSSITSSASLTTKLLDPGIRPLLGVDEQSFSPPLTPKPPSGIAAFAVGPSEAKSCSDPSKKFAVESVSFSPATVESVSVSSATSSQPQPWTSLAISTATSFNSSVGKSYTSSWTTSPIVSAVPFSINHDKIPDSNPCTAAHTIPTSSAISPGIISHPSTTTSTISGPSSVSCSEEKLVPNHWPATTPTTFIPNPSSAVSIAQNVQVTESQPSLWIAGNVTSAVGSFVTSAPTLQSVSAPANKLNSVPFTELPVTTVTLPSVSSPAKKLDPVSITSRASPCISPVKNVCPDRWAMASVTSAVSAVDSPIKKLDTVLWTKHPASSNAPSSHSSYGQVLPDSPVITLGSDAWILPLPSAVPEEAEGIGSYREFARALDKPSSAKVYDNATSHEVYKAGNVTYPTNTTSSKYNARRCWRVSDINEQTSETLRECVKQSLLEDCFLKVRRWQQTLPPMEQIEPKYYGNSFGNGSQCIVKCSTVHNGRPLTESCNISTKINLLSKPEDCAKDVPCSDPIFVEDSADEKKSWKCFETSDKDGHLGRLRIDPCECWQPDYYKKKEKQQKSRMEYKPQKKSENFVSNCSIPSLNLDGLVDNSTAHSTSKSSLSSCSGHACIPHVIYLPCECRSVNIKSAQPLLQCPERKVKKKLELHKICSKNICSCNHYRKKDISKDFHNVQKFSSQFSVDTITSYKSIQRKNIVERGNTKDTKSCDLKSDRSNATQETVSSLPSLLPETSQNVRESDLERRRELGEQTRIILSKLLKNFEHLYISDDDVKEDSRSYKPTGDGEKSETILGVENGDEKSSPSPGSKENKAIDVLTCLDQLDICAKQIKSHSDAIIRFLSTRMDLPVPKIALN